MIELQHLTIGYGNRAVLTDINQTIPDGQMICLLGANGVGKSTLLRTLSGFIPPLSGKVLLQGRELSSLSLSELSRSVSVVLTERVEVPNMKVVDLVGMGRSPYTGFFGMLSSEDRDQKAMLAKALAQQTQVILLDEPTAFLDFHAKANTLRLLSQLAHETGKSIFLSTHDVEMALRLSDILWIVLEGRILSGTTDSLTQDGTLKRFLEPFELSDLQASHIQGS